MAMPKARFVHQVKFNTETNMVDVKVSYDELPNIIDTEDISALSLREMIRAAMNVGITGTDGGRGGWNEWSKDDLLTAVIGKATTVGYEARYVARGARTETPTPAPAPEADREIACRECGRPVSNHAIGCPWKPANLNIEPAPVPAPVLTNTPAATDDVAAAMATLMAAMAPKQSLDETAVRAMVDAAMTATLGNRIADAVAHLAPQVTRVEIPTREPVEIEGHQHKVFPEVLKLIGMGKHVFLVGPAGTGKSTIGERAAHALGLTFRQLSLSPDTGKYELFGFVDARGEYIRTAFRDQYEHGGVFVLDEIDNGNEGVLAALNSALANGGIDFPDTHVKRHDDFRVVATGNTAGTGATMQFIGRNTLDFATLDRFEMVRVEIDHQVEHAMVSAVLDDASKVNEILGWVRQWRKNADDHRIYDVSLSPRRAVSVATMIAGGFTIDRACEIAIWKGATPDQVRKIKGAR